MKLKTDPDEFNKFIELLPSHINPHLIPVRYDKSPDVPRGESIKDDKYKLTIREARSRIKEGENVGMYLRDDFAVMDVDDPQKALDFFDGDITKKTLTVKSRSGNPHLWFLKGEGIEGRDIPNVVELRVGWRYVLVPGSCAYDKKEFEDTGKKNWGLYSVANANKPVKLCVDDLPRELKATAAEDVHVDLSARATEGGLANKHGWKLEDIRHRDGKLDKLLVELNPRGGGYPSRSEADLGAVQKLLFWEFGDNTICHILRRFRPYEKTDREDYLVRTLKKAKSRVGETISQNVNPSSWNPVDGLKYLEKGKFIPKYLADEIMSDHDFITLEDTREIYVYEGGVYLPKGETTIEGEAQARLGKYSRKHYQNEVVNYIRSATYTPRERLDENPYRVVVENGVLDLETLELKPHSPNPPSTIKIPVKYDPSAECPKIENFLSEVLKTKDIPVIQEFVGYSLLKNYKFHKAIMLTGGGANGKSTLLNLVRKLLGRDNVSSPGLHDLLVNRFAKADLFGKLANIHADIPNNVLKQTGAFKMLTGEDQIYAEKKHRDAFHFDNYAKLLFSANEIPETKDVTRAFFERWFIIEFPYKFTDEAEDGNKDMDPRILEKITTRGELSGFLNWALEGLERLLENGKFSSELTVEERADIWAEMSDPIVAFKEAKLVVRPDVYGTKEEVYNAYVKFCHERDTPPLDKNIFGRELPKRIPVETYRPRIEGRQTWCWKGITLKHNSKVIQDIQDTLYNKGNTGVNVSNTVYDIESNLDILDQKKSVDQILRLLKHYGGKTPEEIADKLGMQLKNVEKILEALFNTRVVEREQEKLGGGKIYNIVREVDYSG